MYALTIPTFFPIPTQAKALQEESAFYNAHIMLTWENQRMN